MAMWDRIKDNARGGRSRGSGSTSGGRGGGMKAQLVSTFKTQLAAAKSELKSGAYRDASMAVCALVAAADGTVDPSERQRVESLIVSNEVLQNFPADDLRKRFNAYVNQLQSNFYLGKTTVIQDIAKTKKKPAEARAVIQTGVVIAGADGYFAPAEQDVLREVCMALEIPPAEFGLG